MNCNEAKKAGPFLNGQLKDTERNAFERHLETCMQCYAELTVFKSLKQITVEKESRPFVAEAVSDIMHNLQTEDKTPRRKVAWKVAAKIYPKNKRGQ